jgi:hypothetical protein
MLGTLIYIIVGLGLMAEPMIAIAEKLKAEQPVLEILPEVFLTMGQAVTKIVPALGTTVGGLLAEMLATSVKRTFDHWHGAGWEGGSAGNGEGES